MKKKRLPLTLKILLLCVPLYPLHIIGEWYFVKTTVIGRKFNFKEETRTYWKDIWVLLREEKEKKQHERKQRK